MMEKTEIIVVNRIPTLRKLTVAALTRLGWENILEFSAFDEGIKYAESHPNDSVLILEFTGNHFEAQIDLVKSVHGKLLLLITLQNAEKEIILKLSKAGATNIIIKSFDISEYSQKLTRMLDSLIQPQAVVTGTRDNLN